MTRFFLPVLLFAASLPLSAAERTIGICHEFGCKQRTEVVISDAFARSLTPFFTPQAASPTTERRQIAASIAYLEARVGDVTGTDRDIGGNYDPERDYPGQMDCIDESRNTTTYLRLLESLGLLHWHRPIGRRFRSPFLVDGHWTAVIEEKRSGQRYAVDSWYHDNGQPPEIQPLEDWLRRKRPR